MDKKTQSVLHIGDYEVSPGNRVHWHSLVDDNSWSIPLKSVKYGQEEVEISSKAALIDSGTSRILIPQKDMEALDAIWSRDMKGTFNEEFGLTGYECSRV